MNEVTWALDRVNHAQVASGVIPEVVIKQDIPAERSNEEAHEIYAKAGVSWIVWRYEENFEADVVDEQQGIFQQYQVHLQINYIF